MFAVVLIVALFSAMDQSPTPLGPVVKQSYLQDVRVAEAPPAPGGLPWQTVIAPYLQQPPQASGWAR